MNKIPPECIKLVIFDLDGTLVDAYPAIADSINFMMTKMGRKAPPFHVVKRSVGWGVDSLVATFIEPENAAKALEIFRQHHDGRLRQNIRLLPGAKKILSFLKKNGVVLAIASNRPTKFCRIILKAVGVDQYFDHMICGDAVKRAKPYPDMVLKILKASRLKAKDAIFVGDMSVDIICGRRAKVYTVGIPTGSCTISEIREAKPCRVIRHLEELKRLFPRPRAKRKK